MAITTNFRAGSSSGSQQLTDADEIYRDFFNESRESRPVSAVIGTSTFCEYSVDGINDDVQIQAAIDACNAAGGGIVFIRAGTYNLANNNSIPAILSGAIPYCGLILKNKVTLMGEGMGKTILNTTSAVTGTGLRYISIVNNLNGDVEIGLANLSIQVPDFLPGVGAYWSGGFWFEGTSRAFIQNVRILKGAWRIDGGQVSFDGTTHELTTDAQDIYIDNLIVDQALGSASFYNVKSARVLNSKFYEIYDDSFLIGERGQDITFDNSTFDGRGNTNYAGGLASAHIYAVNNVEDDVYGISDIKINNCSFKRFAGVTGDGIRLLKTKNVSITNNMVDRCEYGIHGVGITENTKIFGNTIRHCDGYGVWFTAQSAGQYHKKIKVNDNIVYNNTTFAIRVDTTISTGIDQVTIQGNTIYDDQGAPTMTHGVSLRAAEAGVVMSDVNVQDNNIDDTITTKVELLTASGGSITGIVGNNNNYVTEASGTGTINSGATSATVTHGLDVTPRAQDITITLTENPTNTPGAIWVDTIGATTFNVNCENDPGGSNLDFAWNVQNLRRSW